MKRPKQESANADKFHHQQFSTHASLINQGRTNRDALWLVKLAVSTHLDKEQGDDQRERQERLAHGGARKL